MKSKRKKVVLSRSAHQMAFLAMAQARATNPGPLEKLTQQMGGIFDHCQMCGHDSTQHLEPAFTPTGQPKILCLECRIGSAESLAASRPRFNSSELATVLAALRFWQSKLGEEQELPVGEEDQYYEDFFVEHPSLSSHDIDALCERLNVKA